MRILLKLVLFITLLTGCAKESYIDDLKNDSSKTSTDPRDKYVGVYKVSSDATSGYVSVVKGDNNTLYLSRLCIDIKHHEGGAPSKMTMDYSTNSFSLEDVWIDNIWEGSSYGSGNFYGNKITYSFSYFSGSSVTYSGEKVESFSK